MDVDIPKTVSTQQNSGALSGGGQHASRAGRSNGSSGGSSGGGSIVGRPRFDASVVNNGYRWWYIDATSDDGLHGLTLIAFVGSVFSPYYFRARKNGMADPENYCAINVALYGKHKRWAMTERGARHTSRSANRFSVGPSSMSWENGSLVITLNERCVPLPFALRGRVIFTPKQLYESPVMLDADAKHFWQAVAPHGRINVEMESPNVSWAGSAYHDMNWGEEPLERGFEKWNWCRSATPHGTHVFYDLTRRDGTRLSFGRKFENGFVHALDVPHMHALSRGFWSMPRDVASETQPRLIETLEDAPFYTRNHIGMTIAGERREAIHESLSLKRFAHPIVQLMLPFRMPRRR